MSTRRRTREEQPPSDAAAPGALVWAALPGSPQWPAAIATPATAAQRREAKKAAAGKIMVVFFGDGSFAFVPSSAVKPYTGSGTAAKRSKNAKLQHALEEADAQLARQGGKAVHVGRGKRGATTTTAVKPAGDGSAVLPVVEADIPPATAAAEGDAFHGMSEYEARRLENIRRNAEMLAQLNLQGPIVADVVEPDRAAQKERGLRTAQRRREAAPKLPARRSRRVAGLDIHGEALPPGQKSTTLAEEQAAARAVPDTIEGDIDAVHGPLDDMEEDDAMFERRRRIILDVASLPRKAVPAASVSGHKHLTRLRMDENSVTKVVPERIFSIAFHPNAERALIMTGDKRGYLGVLDTDNADAEGCVSLFRPHTRPLSSILVDPRNTHKVYTSSYDGTVRCWDTEHSQFLETAVFADHAMLSYADMLWDKSTIVGCHSDGTATLTDIRAGKTPQHTAQLHERKISHVHINPVDNNLMVTTSLDKSICLWDVRKLTDKRPRALATASHHKSIAGGYFSYQGNRLVTVGHDDLIKVFDDVRTQAKKGGVLTASLTIRHNNNTGRWLTNFKPTWDPKSEAYFAVGAMARPRCINVIDASSGVGLYDLGHPEYFTSVTSLHAFHPTRNMVAGGNSSGRVSVLREL